MEPGGMLGFEKIGKTLDVAWERVFVCSLTYKNYSSITKSISSTSLSPVKRWPVMLLQKKYTQDFHMRKKSKK
jgi:hypothetical protein